MSRHAWRARRTGVSAALATRPVARARQPLAIAQKIPAPLRGRVNASSLKRQLAPEEHKRKAGGLLWEQPLFYAAFVAVFALVFAVLAAVVFAVALGLAAFALAAGFFVALALPVPPFATLAAINSSASSSVIVSGETSWGRVALPLPGRGWGP